ncbi:unnamed protein product [Paramecium sonneborni]|uniref:Uncharacterized protein n=1 Tax=Paramecium sonneborni TaxID=65129 RepID=A0A8S1MIM3_9CILI|nr:unnamed protein product [Paramecium sonneborni]
MITVSIILYFFNSLPVVLKILSWIYNFYFLTVNYTFKVDAFFLNNNWSNPLCQLIPVQIQVVVFKSISNTDLEEIFLFDLFHLNTLNKLNKLI